MPGSIKSHYHKDSGRWSNWSLWFWYKLKDYWKIEILLKQQFLCNLEWNLWFLKWTMKERETDIGIFIWVICWAWFYRWAWLTFTEDAILWHACLRKTLITMIILFTGISHTFFSLLLLLLLFFFAICSYFYSLYLFIFLLYNTVLVLQYIDMNPPWVYIWNVLFVSKWLLKYVVFQSLGKLEKS